MWGGGIRKPSSAVIDEIHQSPNEGVDHVGQKPIDEAEQEDFVQLSLTMHDKSFDDQEADNAGEEKQQQLTVNSGMAITPLTELVQRSVLYHIPFATSVKRPLLPPAVSGIHPFTDTGQSVGRTC